MDPRLPGAQGLWAAFSNPWFARPVLARAHALFTVATVLGCLLADVTYAQDSSSIQVPPTQNPYIRAVATLYQQAKYEEALTRLDKALEWKANEKQEVLWLKLMQGVLQAELAQGAALESFKQALALDAEAQLPVKGSRRLRKLFEQARSTLALSANEALLGQEWEPSPGAPGAAEVPRPPPRRYGLAWAYMARWICSGWASPPPSLRE
jgi:tetratricopeptide (TPR) repeat protein